MSTRYRGELDMGMGCFIVSCLIAASLLTLAGIGIGHIIQWIKYG